MGNVDPSKIDEIRRTVYVGNLNSQVTTALRYRWGEFHLKWWKKPPAATLTTDLQLRRIFFLLKRSLHLLKVRKNVSDLLLFLLCISKLTFKGFCFSPADDHRRPAAGVLQAGGRCEVCADGRRRDPTDALRLRGVRGAGLRRQSPDLQRSHVWRQTSQVGDRLPLGKGFEPSPGVQCGFSLQGQSFQQRHREASRADATGCRQGTGECDEEGEGSSGHHRRCHRARYGIQICCTVVAQLKVFTCWCWRSAAHRGKDALVRSLSEDAALPFALTLALEITQEEVSFETPVSAAFSSCAGKCSVCPVNNGFYLTPPGADLHRGRGKAGTLTVPEAATGGALALKTKGTPGVAPGLQMMFNYIPAFVQILRLCFNKMLNCPAVPGSASRGRHALKKM